MKYSKQELSDRLILPVLFVVFTIAQLLKDANVLWAGSYVLMGLFLLTKWSFLREKLKGGHLWRELFPFLVLILTQIPLCVAAWRSGINPVSAPVLLCGYLLLCLVAGCVRFPAQDTFHQSLRWISFLIFLSALFGLFEAVADYLFPVSFVHQFIDILTITARNITRVQSLFRNPLPAAMVFQIGFWLPSFFQNRYMKWVEKGIMAAALVMTLSRSAWMGLLFSVLLYLVLERKKVAEAFRALPARVKVLVFVLCAGVLLFLVFSGLLRIFWNRLQFTTADWPFMVRFSNIRVYLTAVIWESSPLQLLIGHGFWTSWNFMINSGEAYGIYTFADNTYMTILYDHGILLMLVFFLLAWRMWKCLRDRNSTETDKVCARAALACAPPAFFYDVTYWPVPMILIIYCCAPFFKKRGTRKTTPSPRTTPYHRLSRALRRFLFSC